MILETERLILRPWQEEDAESLYEFAKNPEVGPIAGWPPHKDATESLSVIRNVLSGKECYAICLKENNIAIGAVELKLNGTTDMTEKDDECELGYWIGQPFWGQGYMPEAAKELLRRGFEDLGMQVIWCGYYDGNTKSKRVQEKIGFVFHHTCNEVPVPLMNEVRVGHTNVMTREQWYKERSKMTHIEKANDLFKKKFHCSQAVFAAFAEELGITEEQALKIGACFGSGMRKGEVCGACTGALMALGLKYGQCDEEDLSSRMKTNNVTDRFMAEFKKENGTFLCKELLGCDLTTEEGIAFAMEKKLFTEFCPKMVASATKIVEDILNTEE